MKKRPTLVPVQLEYRHMQGRVIATATATARVTRTQIFVETAVVTCKEPERQVYFVIPLRYRHTGTPIPYSPMMGHGWRLTEDSKRACREAAAKGGAK